jgi:hypothetical protein
VHFSVIKDCDLGKKGELGKKIRRTNLGYFCNNDGKHFVKDMKYCPARFASTRPVSKEAQVMVDELVKTNFGKVVKKPLKKVKRSVKKPVKKPVKKMIKKR